MSRISIVDLEVHYCVGVTDEERAKPQRLLLTVDLSLDFSSASISDRIEKSIDYQQVADELVKFGEGRNWKLLESSWIISRTLSWRGLSLNLCS